MSKITLKNASDENVEIDVIRYFENNDNEYLIYSLNETVGDGYIKLYASKIIGNNAKIITDDDEWQLIKEIIKNVIKGNHEGEPLNIFDLDESELSNINLQDTRIFKLQGNLVNLLSDNKHVIKKEPVLPSIEDIEETLTEVLEDDYQSLYESEKQKNVALLSEIDNLREELNEYKGKIKEIEDLIKE